MENFERKLNRGGGKIPDTEIARKFQEIIKRKKAAEGKPTDNPETVEEIQKDLEEMGLTKQRGPFGEKDAEDIVKKMLGEDIFERPDIGLEENEKPKDLGAAAKKKKEKYIPYPYSERKRIKELIDSYKDRLEKARMKESKETYKEKIEYLRQELRKANAAIEKIEKEKRQK